jgi:hypothetical protein
VGYTNLPLCAGSTQRVINAACVQSSLYNQYNLVMILDPTHDACTMQMHNARGAPEHVPAFDAHSTFLILALL